MSAPRRSTNVLNAEIVVERSPHRSHAYMNSTGSATHRDARDAVPRVALGDRMRASLDEREFSTCEVQIAILREGPLTDRDDADPDRIGTGGGWRRRRGTADERDERDEARIGATSGPGRLARTRDRPNRSVADADIDRTPADDEGGRCASSRVDLRDCPVDRVRDPDSAVSDGYAHRFATDRDRLHDMTGRGIDLVQLVRDLTGHPD